MDFIFSVNRQTILFGALLFKLQVAAAFLFIIIVLWLDKYIWCEGLMRFIALLCGMKNFVRSFLRACSFLLGLMVCGEFGLVN